MKPVLFLSFLFAGSLIAQQSQICHEPLSGSASNQRFVAFAESPRFRDQHSLRDADPAYEDPGKMISYDTPDGKSSRAWFLESDNSSDRYVFLLHEWWGLNQFVREEGIELQQALGDVNVLALDLYDGNVATTRDKASEYMRSVTPERAHAIIMGALDWIGEDAKIATVGWCFGGGWSLQTALKAGDRNLACVIYYGMPEDDVKILRGLKGPVLGIFASRDGWINGDVVAAFERNMEEAGQDLRVEVYDADHAFANPSSPRHNAEAATDAFSKTVDFLKRNFSPK